VTTGNGPVKQKLTCVYFSFISRNYVNEYTLLLCIMLCFNFDSPRIVGLCEYYFFIVFLFFFFILLAQNEISKITIFSI